MAYESNLIFAVEVAGPDPEPRVRRAATAALQAFGTSSLRETTMALVCNWVREDPSLYLQHGDKGALLVWGGVFGWFLRDGAEAPAESPDAAEVQAASIFVQQLWKSGALLASSSRALLFYQGDEQHDVQVIELGLDVENGDPPLKNPAVRVRRSQVSVSWHELLDS